MARRIGCWAVLAIAAACDPVPGRLSWSPVDEEEIGLPVRLRFPHGFHVECSTSGVDGCGTLATFPLPEWSQAPLTVSFATWLAADLDPDARHPLVEQARTDVGGHWQVFVERSPRTEAWSLLFVATSDPVEGDELGQVGEVRIGLGSDDVALEHWVHVAAVLDPEGGRLELYRDGRLADHVEIPRGGWTFPGALRVGWGPDERTAPWADPLDGADERPPRQLQGYVEDVRLDTGASLPEDVAALYRDWERSAFREVEVFRATDDSCYRIPAVVRSPDGPLVALAERRHGFEGYLCSDAGDHDIVARVSSDEGRSWGPIQVVVSAASLRERYVGDVDRGFAAAGNPTPVFDAEGRLLLFFNVSYNDDEPDAECSVSSCGNQQGRIQSFDPRDLAHVGRAAAMVGLRLADGEGLDTLFTLDLTGELLAVVGDDVRWHGFGPGHAIALDPGALRLREPHAESEHDILGVPFFFNRVEDGEVVPAPPTVVLFDATVQALLGTGPTRQRTDGCADGRCAASELQAVQLADGTLQLNSRSVPKGCDDQRRVFTLAPGEDTWSGESDDMLVDAMVHGSTLRLAGGEIAFANAACWAQEWAVGDDLCRGHRFRMRRNMTVRLRDERGSWRSGRVVRAGSAGYSDLVDLGGRIGLLYEAPRGDAGGAWVLDAAAHPEPVLDRMRSAGLPTHTASAYYDRGISFASFTLQWVEEGDDGRGHPDRCDETTFLDQERLACREELARDRFEPDSMCVHGPGDAGEQTR